MGLYARSLLIVIIPMVLLQSVVAFIFMERHWQLVTQRLSAAVTGDIAAIVDLIATFPADRDISEIVRIARDQLNLSISVEPGGELPPPRPKPFFEILDQILSEEISDQVRRPFWIDTVGNSNLVEIRIKLDDGRMLRVYARRNQAYASNTHIFIVWMVGASLVLLIDRHPVPARADPADPGADQAQRKVSARARRSTTSHRVAPMKSAAPALPSSRCASASSARSSSAPPCSPASAMTFEPS